MSLYYGYHDDKEDYLTKEDEKKFLTKEGGEITRDLILNKATIRQNPTKNNDIINLNFIYDLL